MVSDGNSVRGLSLEGGRDEDYMQPITNRGFFYGENLPYNAAEGYLYYKPSYRTLARQNIDGTGQYMRTHL